MRCIVVTLKVIFQNFKCNNFRSTGIHNFLRQAATLIFLSLLFFEKARKTIQKSKDFSLCRTPKIPGQKGKTIKKARKFLATKKARKPNKARKGRSGKCLKSASLQAKSVSILGDVPESEVRKRGWRTEAVGDNQWQKRTGQASLLTIGACLLTVELLCLQSVEVLMKRTFPLFWCAKLLGFFFSQIFGRENQMHWCVSTSQPRKWAKLTLNRR